MRVLIVNNRSKHTKKICSRINNHVVVDFMSLHEVTVSDFDAVILTGGGYIPVIGNDEAFADELSIIKDAKVPILGICLGFELICHAFNEELVFSEVKRQGEYTITTVQNNPLFSSTFTAYEAHRWSVKQIHFLEILATSDWGVEAVKHHTLPIYGVQFHPEVSGPNVIQNFLRLVRTFL